MAVPPAVAEPDEWEEWQPGETSFAVHCAAGSLAGVAEHVLMYPVDTFKTHMQVSRSKVAAQRTLMSFTREFGLRRMWRGVPAVVYACVPSHAAYFSLYEASKRALGVDRPGHHPIAAFAVGAIATTVHDGVLTPLDVVKQRMQLGYYGGVGDAVRSILRSEGPAAFFRSFPTTLAMNLPTAGVTVAANESLKRALNPSGEYNMPVYLLSGAIAGGLAALVTNPMDVVKTRLQTQSLGRLAGASAPLGGGSPLGSTQPGSAAEAEVDGRNLRVRGTSAPGMRVQVAPYYTVPAPRPVHRPTVEYKGVFDAVRRIYAEGGAGGFFRGASARVLVNAPAAAISWGTYEAFKHILTLEKKK